MRAFCLFPVIALIGCASHTPPDASPAAEAVRVSGRTSAGPETMSFRTGSRSDFRVDTLWVALDRIWRALPTVYGALEIPISDFDAEKNTIGNSGMKVYRRLGQTPLTKYLDCGRTQIGPSAETYDILMSVLTRLTRVDSATTVVVTTVAASGRPMQFAGSQARCQTTGELEAQLVLVLKARLQ